MNKFHINGQGQATVCRAVTRACPLGGEHFDSMEEAAMASMEAELTQSFSGEGHAAGLADDDACTLCGTEVGNPWDAWCDPCAKREFKLYLSGSKYQ